MLFALSLRGMRKEAALGMIKTSFGSALVCPIFADQKQRLPVQSVVE